MRPQKRVEADRHKTAFDRHQYHLTPCAQQLLKRVFRVVQAMGLDWVKGDDSRPRSKLEKWKMGGLMRLSSLSLTMQRTANTRRTSAETGTQRIRNLEELGRWFETSVPKKKLKKED